MICDKCGSDAGNANFCPSCGANMQAAQPAAPNGQSPLDVEETLWQGKPSNIGDKMKWFFNSTRYTITNQRVIVRHGLLRKSIEEVDLRMVKDYRVRQSVGERIQKTGDVIIISVDPSVPSLELKNVPGAEGVKEILRKAVLNYKRHLGVVSEEKL